MNKQIRWLLYAAIVALYVLHNDFWFWYDPRLVLGLPIGLTYHVGYNLAAAVLMFLLVRFAWPSHLEVAAELPAGTGQTAAGQQTTGSEPSTNAGEAGGER